MVTEAIYPSDALARTAARNALFALEVVEQDPADTTMQLARFLVLKTLDAEWTEEVVSLLARHPGAVGSWARLPLRGDPVAAGPWGAFRRDLYALLRRHCMTALLVRDDGAFCGLRLKCRTDTVWVAGRATVGRWDGAALMAKHDFDDQARHYLKRLSGATLVDCATRDAEIDRSLGLTDAVDRERRRLKIAEYRFRELVRDCCSDRRPNSALFARVRRAQPSPRVAL
jgi:hypothetical protein